MRLIFFLALVFLVSPLSAAGLQQFTADYEIFYGNIHLGKARYRFSHSGDNSYRFDFKSDLRFLIFSDRRVVTSEILFENSRLLPVYYSHDREGTGRDYFEEIEFDRSNKLIRTTYKKESKELPYEEDIVDGLTVQLQIMLDLQRGIKQPKYKIIDVNRVREREFSFVSEEVLEIEGQQHPSVVYQVVRDNNKRTTRMWFSTEQNHLPIQMVHYSKGKKKFNAHLVQYEEIDSQ